MSEILPRPVLATPLPRRRLGRFDRVTIDGIDHVGKGRVRGGIVLQRVDSGVCVDFTDEAFHELEAGDRAHVARNHFRASDAALRVANPQILSIGDLAPEEQRELLFAERLLTGVERIILNGGASLSDDALRDVIGTVHAEILASDLMTLGGRSGARRRTEVFCAPSPATFREWRRRYRNSDYNVLALRDGRKGRAGSKGRQIDPMVADVFYRWVGSYADEREPSKAGLYRLFCAEVTPLVAAENERLASDGLQTMAIPSARTFERAIDDLDAYRVVYAREGETAAKRRFRMSGKRIGALRPGERVILDHWQVHLQTIFASTEAWKAMSLSDRKSIGRVRLQVCLALCEATRVPLGLHIAPTASGENARAALAQVCKDKTDLARAAGCRSSWNQHCSPERIATDAGSEFLYAPFRSAVRDLHAEHEVGPAGHPEVRAVLERQFRTLGGVLANFTGRTLSGIADLGDRSPMERASLCVDAIAPVIVRFLVDVHMNTPHAGLGGETPADAWERLSALYGTLPPPPAHRLRAIFGYSDTRRLGREGVRFLGLRYRSEELARVRRRKGSASVAIRVDLDDLGSLSIREGAASPWLTVPCDTDGMDGISAKTWIEAAEAIRRHHAQTASVRQEIVHAALLELRRIGDEAAIATGLETAMPTPAEMARIEKRLFTGFSIRPDIGRGQTLEQTSIALNGPITDQEAANVEDGEEEEVSSTVRRRGAVDFLLGKD